MYQYDLADIVKWFSDSYDKAMVAVVWPDGSGGIYPDTTGFPSFPFGGGRLDPCECLLEFDNLDDMVNRFDHLLTEG